MEKETLDRAAEGDPEAIRELERWAGTRDSLRLKRLKEIFEKAEKERGEEEARFWSELLDLKNAVNANPAAAAEALDEMWPWAQALGSCETVQILGLRSWRFVLLRDLYQAEEELNKAWELVSLCPHAEAPGLSPCVSYLNRRHGVLDMELDRPEKGLAKVEASLEGYRNLSGPIHDVNGDGEGSSLYTRAEIRFELGDHGGSLADLSACLKRFPVTSSMWPRAHQNFALVLSETGEAGRKQAYKMLGKLRYSFRTRQTTVEWATFWWLDSQLAVATGRRRDRAQRKLLEVLDCFHRLKMPYHYDGVVHDICRIQYPDTEEMKGFLKRITSAANRLSRERQVGSLIRRICDLVKVYPTQAVLGHLDVLLRQLRSLLMTRAPLPPCLLTDTGVS